MRQDLSGFNTYETNQATGQNDTEVESDIARLPKSRKAAPKWQVGSRFFLSATGPPK